MTTEAVTRAREHKSSAPMGRVFTFGGPWQEYCTECGSPWPCTAADLLAAYDERMQAAEAERDQLRARVAHLEEPGTHPETVEAAARAIHETYCHKCDPAHDCRCGMDLAGGVLMDAVGAGGCAGPDEDDVRWARAALQAARDVRAGGRS